MLWEKLSKVSWSFHFFFSVSAQTELAASDGAVGKLVKLMKWPLLTLCYFEFCLYYNLWFLWGCGIFFLERADDNDIRSIARDLFASLISNQKARVVVEHMMRNSWYYYWGKAIFLLMLILVFFLWFIKISFLYVWAELLFYSSFSFFSLWRPLLLLWVFFLVLHFLNCVWIWWHCSWKEL